LTVTGVQHMDANFLSQLPPEYQAEVQKLMRQQQMAQAMQQSSLQRLNRPTQFSGQYAVKNSPIAAIADALGMYLGGKQVEAADTGIADVAKRYETSTSEEIGRLNQAQDPSVVKSFRGSMNPRVRAVAEAMIKQQMDVAGKGADVLKDSNPAAALEALRSGSLPSQYTPPNLKQPEVRWIDDPNTPGKKIAQTLNYDKFGLGKATLGTQGSTVSVDARQAGREQEMAFDATKTGLKSRQEKAEVAKQTLFSTRGALEAINDGAKSGGLEGWKLAGKKWLQGIGVPTENITSTEELAMAMGNQVLAKARALAPVTGEDVKRLEAILGSINTDPQALQKMLAITESIAMRELQDYNKYLAAKEGAMTDPTARAALAGEGIGYEPLPPGGNTQQGLRSIQELQKRGGDVSQFAVGGQPIPADARFDIRGPAAPMPGAPPKLDEKKVYTIDELRKMGYKL